MSTGICRWLFLIISFSIWTTITNSKEIRVVCYYTNWSVYRPGTAKFSPQNINPYLCTHLIYAFGGFTKENTLKPFDKYQDIEKGGYAKFTGLKTYNKNLKTMLAIGGWNEGSSRFSPMVANPERRKELVKNAIKFLRQNHFDGLDLDWEYPSFRDGGKSRDKDNYAQLVKELRDEFERESEKTGRPRLLLTMAVPAGIEYINKGYDIPKLTKYLDWMNILSYDYHSAFEPAVNHHAPLYSLEEASEYNYDTELNIDYTIKHYLDLGADRSKLVIGIPTYGRSYTLFNPDANEIGAPADGPGDMGEATRENGYLAYYEICENVKEQDWEVVQPNSKAMGPYAFKDNQWVGYDDENIARKKAQYVAENSLGGVMFWAIDNDDFRGNCHNKPYPIIEAAKEALIEAYGITDENLISPPSKPLKSRTKTHTRTSSTKSNIDEDSKVTNTRNKTANSRRRNRVKTKDSSDSETSNERNTKLRKKESKTNDDSSTHSSLKVVTPSYTTPAPPSTPDQGGDFKCEDEGFFPHPKDCKKYFWCLSGPGELGTVAHQFTCPAGLYFNKAADSCDYTQNVLCNKKLSRATTTTTTPASKSATTTTPKTSTNSIFTTSRPTSKLASILNRKSTTTTTTTEAYEEEYEYEDDEDKGIDSEEDPKVIKELFALIKKAGGIEELERQLKLHEDGGSSSSGATTQSSISKTLDRVLKGRNNLVSNKIPSIYSSTNRNSRGPQNHGLSKEVTSSKSERGRPQYTSIARQRNTNVKPVEEEVDEGEDDAENEQTDNKVNTSKPTSKRPNQPEYVNIRRARVSTTTTDPIEDTETKSNRNKALGEEEGNEDSDDVEEAIKSRKQATRNTTPQYVNIRRQRPSTTEESSTTKYVNLRRGTTSPSTKDGEEENENSDVTTPKYSVLLRRGSTTKPASVDENEQKTPNSSDGSTTLRYVQLRRGSTTEQSTTEPTSNNGETTTSRYKTITRGTTTARESLNTVSTISDNTKEAEITTELLLNTNTEPLTITKDTNNLSTTKIVLNEQTTENKLQVSIPPEAEDAHSIEKQTPQLLEPRPFSISTNGPTTSLKHLTETTTQIPKVSELHSRFRVRQKTPDLHDDISTQNQSAKVDENKYKTKLSSRSQIGENPEENSFANRRRGFTTNKPIHTDNLKFKARPLQRTLDENLEDEDFIEDRQNIRSTLDPTLRARKRFSTTESYNDANEQQSRSYRPDILADFSSLTALDFNIMNKEYDGSKKSRRVLRPRPTTVSTTTVSTTTEESLKTGPRTLTLARQHLNGTVFGNSRRAVNRKPNDDQLNSNSDSIVSAKRVRGFSRTTTDSLQEATESSTSNPVSPIARRVIRRFRTTSRPARENSDNNDNNDNKTIRGANKLTLPDSVTSSTVQIRRFTLPDHNENELLNRSSSRLPYVLKRKKQIEDHTEYSSAEDSSIEDGENIKLSESNIRENSDVSNGNAIFDNSKTGNRKVIKKIISEPEPVLHEKINLDKKNYEVSNEKDSISSTIKPTESPIIIRTRKIVRKLKPTEATITEHTPGRIRKIIRRLKPFSEQPTLTSEATTEDTTNVNEVTEIVSKKFVPTIKSSLDRKPFILRANGTENLKNDTADTHETKEDTETPIAEDKIKFKPSKSRLSTYGRSTTTPSSEDNTDIESNEEQTKSFKQRINTYNKSTSDSPDTTEALRPVRIRTFGRSTTTSSIEDSNDNKEGNNEPIRIRTFGRSSTTPSSDVEEDNEDDEPNNNHVRIRTFGRTTSTTTEKTEKDIIAIKRPQISRPKYNVLRPQQTNVEDNEDEELLEDEGGEEDFEENDETDHENEDNKEKEEDENTAKEEVDEETTEIPTTTSTTTIRNLILERQQNRPAYVRPKLTTPNPRKTTTDISVGRPKYKTLIRSTTESSSSTEGVSRLQNNTDQDTKDEINSDEKEDTSLKKIPKISLRKYTPIIRTTTAEIVNTTDSTVLKTNDNSTTTENIITTKMYSSNETEETTTRIENSTDTPTENIEKTTIVNEIDTTDITTLKENNEIMQDDITTTENIIDFTTLSYNSSDESNDITTEPLTTTEITITKQPDTTQNMDNDTSTANGTSEATSDKNIDDATSINLDNSTLELSTTTSHPVSTLRSIKQRPTFLVPKRLNEAHSSTTETASSSSKAFRNRNKFNQRDNLSSSTTETSKLPKRRIKPSLPNRTINSRPKINRILYKYSTTERVKYENNKDNEEQTEDEEEYDDNGDEEEYIDENEDKTEDKPTPVRPSFTGRLPQKPSTRYTPKPVIPTRSTNKPRVINKPKSFSRTTEAPIVGDLSDINKDAVKNRNKNLFSKTRKMNTPFTSTAEGKTENETENEKDKDVNLNIVTQLSESVTLPTTQPETTDYPTTLHHIFAEVTSENSLGSSTPTSGVSDRGKVEKLIEINRISEVHGKEDKIKNKSETSKLLETLPVLDKIGAINRITVIKVVDGNNTNSTLVDILENEIAKTDKNQTVTENGNADDSLTHNIPIRIGTNGVYVMPEIASVSEATLTEIKNFGKDIDKETSEESLNRKDRKFEIYGNSKVDYTNKLPNVNIDSPFVKSGGPAEIIDGISHIKVITPRPYYSTEASTIALEGLFQTDSSQNFHDIEQNLLKPTTSIYDDELLETGNSRFVNVRLLDQDETVRLNKGIKDNTNILPIRLLNQDEEITMKAHVVEITPKPQDEIKIIPIKVEMARKIKI